MPPVNVMMKPSSSQCNMRCDYCFYFDEVTKRAKPSFGMMSEETLKNVIRRTMAEAEGHITYAYQGGEPTLRGLDFFRLAMQYQKQYNRKGLKINNALQTNGYLLDEEWCRFLRENEFLVGLSVDGTREIHDSCRHSGGGDPTYDRVRRSAGLLEKYGVDYNILTVVTKEVAGRIEEIYADYKKNGWNYQQYIVCLEPLEEGHGKWGYAPDAKEYGAFLIRLFNLWYEDLQKGQQPYIRQFENYAGIAAGYMAESCDQRGHCSLQTVVEADGSVYPCDFYMLDEYRMGNLNADRMSLIRERGMASGFVERSLALDEGCLVCPHYRLCKGGCQRNRDLNPATGRYENYFCQAYKDFFGSCGDRIYELGERIRQGRSGL